MDRNASLNTVLDLALARTVVIRDMERRLASHGIGLSDLALLLDLYESPDYQAQRVDLAERLGVTASGIARQLLPLERIGLVTRLSDPNDARRAHVVLTDAGVRTVEEVVPGADEAAATALSKRWDKKEQKALAALLTVARL
jgi:DNA-binding MarR family transcriptional regulator